MSRKCWPKLNIARRSKLCLPAWHNTLRLLKGCKVGELFYLVTQEASAENRPTNNCLCPWYIGYQALGSTNHWTTNGFLSIVRYIFTVGRDVSHNHIDRKHERKSQETTGKATLWKHKHNGSEWQWMLTMWQAELMYAVKWAVVSENPVKPVIAENVKLFYVRCCGAGAWS